MANEFKVEIDDTYINVIKFGKGTKNALLLPGVVLTGFEGMGDTLENIYKLFVDDFTFYFIDERKVFGNNSYSIEKMSEDVYYVCKRLNLKQVYVYGVSIGAMIGQCLAIYHPDFVKKLSICSSMCKTTDIMYETATRWIKLAKNYDIVSLNRDFTKTVCTISYYEKLKDNFVSNENKGSKQDCDRFAIMCDTLRHFDIENILKNIKCDVLVIGDNNDKVIGVEGCKNIIDILHCENKLFNEYSHAVYDECYDVQKLVYSFFMKNKNINLGIYKHYKGNYYEVIGIGKHSETMQDLVIYRALYGDYSLWVRPLDMFVEKLLIGDKLVNRFEYVKDKHE